MARICVTVVLPGGNKKFVKDPPRPLDRVLQVLNRSYGAGALTDADGDLVMDDLQAGYYVYAVLGSVDVPVYWKELGSVLHSQKIYGQQESAFDGIFREGNVLLLKDIVVPGFRDVRGGLWVHRIYPVLAATMLAHLEAGTCSFHLIGTSGSGKSAFGIFWLYYLAQMRTKVLYRAKDYRSWVLFDFSGNDPSVQYAESPAAFSNEVDKTTWLIVDGASDPIIHPGPILQCVSAGKKTNYHEFAKGGLYLFMSAWTLEDCSSCVQALGLQLPDLCKRYYYCGGVPRLLFNPRLGVEDLKATIDKSFEEINSVENFSHMLKHPDLLSDKLFHYRYPQEYLYAAVTASREVVMASEYVLHKAEELFKLHDEEQQEKWVRETASVPTAAGFRGNQFEICAHRRLCREGKFRIRRLDGDSRIDYYVINPPRSTHTIYQWELYPGAAVSSYKLSELPKQPLDSLVGDDYVRTVMSNQKAWDSFKVGRDGDQVQVQIYQMTVCLTHPIKWNGVEELMNVLSKLFREKWGQQITISYNLVFVVPADKFGAFPPQAYLRKDGKAPYKKVTMDVVQYALEIVV